MVAAQAFGVSPSAVSQHLVEATTQKLKDFKERALTDFTPFALFLATIHRGGEAFIVALGIDLAGHKRVLGFWQGATENHETCEALLGDLESRGCALVKRILFVTDGGSGLLKALKARCGRNSSTNAARSIRTAISCGICRSAGGRKPIAASGLRWSKPVTRRPRPC